MTAIRQYPAEERMNSCENKRRAGPSSAPPIGFHRRRAYPNSDHMANFIECVKTHKQPCATAAIEHRTVTACHLTNISLRLMNISLRLKRKINWDPEKQEILDDPEANGWQKREQRPPYLVQG